jgi:hypothetical protein
MYEKAALSISHPLHAEYSWETDIPPLYIYIYAFPKSLKGIIVTAQDSSMRSCQKVSLQCHTGHS